MNRLLREACPLEKMFFPENQQTNPVTQRKAVYAMYINNELNATFNSFVYYNFNCTHELFILCNFTKYIFQSGLYGS